MRLDQDEYDWLVRKVIKTLELDPPNTIIAFSNGGFVVAGKIASQLGIASENVVGLPVRKHNGEYWLDQTLVRLFTENWEGRDVLCVDDASNRGLLTRQTADELIRLKVARVRTCVLIANRYGIHQPNIVGRPWDGAPPKMPWETN